MGGAESGKMKGRWECWQVGSLASGSGPLPCDCDKHHGLWVSFLHPVIVSCHHVDYLLSNLEFKFILDPTQMVSTRPTSGVESG